MLKRFVADFILRNFKKVKTGKVTSSKKLKLFKYLLSSYTTKFSWVKKLLH